MLGSLGNSEKQKKGAVLHRIEDLMTTFPRLQERANQLSGTLSGGEQQMLAIARGLMSNPHAFAALRISHRGYVLENGRVVKEGIATALLNDKEIHYHYLGGKAG